MNSTLLLNASFEPLQVIPWQRAITMFFLDKVEVIEEYDAEVRSVSLAIKIPAVVKLISYIHFAKRTPPLSRLNLMARDNYECQYCSKHLTTKTASIDHVIPRSQGGKTNWENVVIACHPCNRKKGPFTPKQASMPLKCAPTKPSWLPVLIVRFDGIPHLWKSFLNH